MLPKEWRPCLWNYWKDSFLSTALRPFEIKTPNDYAQSLSIHVNSLNRSVKEITGKTTSQQITARIIQEANALLKHTDWNISEIAYGLGFEEPAYFTNYFKNKPELLPMP